MTHRRPPLPTVSDHAILRFLEREYGLDIDLIRKRMAGHAVKGAELDALAVRIGRVKLVLRDGVVVTALPKHRVPKHWKPRKQR